METAIERFVFGDMGVQGVTQFAISQDAVRIAFVPLEKPWVATIASFHESHLIYTWASKDAEDDFELPWQVIGFDCYELFGGRWRFVMNCAVIEWSFESAWPVVERVGV